MQSDPEEEWFNNDSFWEHLFPVLFPEDQFREAETDIDNILSLVDRPIRTILDLCCGPGRFAGPFAQRGFAVTGVDRTALFLEKAKARFPSGDSPVEWVKEDMRRFVRPASYDLVLSMYTSFGYFTDPEDDLVVLKNIATSLKPGGTFLLDLMGKEILARIFEPVTASRCGEYLLVQEHGLRNNWTRIANLWTLVKDGEVFSFSFEHTIYGANDITRLCGNAGLADIRVFGDFKGSPYDNHAKRLVLVGRKKKG